MLAIRLFDASSARALCLRAQSLSFVDGAATAGWHARHVKKNLQAEPDEAYLALAKEVAGALDSHAAVSSACLPLRLSPLIVSRYESGMEYGAHVDDAIRAGSPPLRADISFTLFLSDPADYDGGALAILSGDERRVRLEAGCAIFYPSDTLHRVEPVTRGSRVAVVGWMQSLVRCPARRQILADLDAARRHVFETTGKDALFDTLARSHANLLRMWSDL